MQIFASKKPSTATIVTLLPPPTATPQHCEYKDINPKGGSSGSKYTKCLV